MTKTDLVAKLAEAGGIKKAQAERVLSAVVDTIKDALAKNERVALPGLGSFSSTTRAARTGRNPRTGAAIKIPARKVVKFSTATATREALNTTKKAPAKAKKK
jgi:DNA-binding protein HU-beta